MSFTQTKNIEEGHGYGMKITCGTYTSDAVTAGTITTGLRRVVSLLLQPKGSAVLANQDVVSTTSQSMPSEHDGVVIVTTSGDVGNWIAVGY